MLERVYSDAESEHKPTDDAINCGIQVDVEVLHNGRNADGDAANRPSRNP